MSSTTWTADGSNAGRDRGGAAMDSRCVQHSPLAASPAGASAKEAILSGVSSLDASVRMTASVSSRSLVVGGASNELGKDLRIGMRKQSQSGN
jgi:hypothetical protein